MTESQIANPFVNFRGRGSPDTLPNRFEQLSVSWDMETFEELRQSDPEFEPPTVNTVFYRDDSQSIISYNSSPDVGFDASLNPYRGCEHGCAYCYARPSHEYLGFNAGIDFESKIMVKPDAARLLEKELAAKRWVPKVLACSGVTDCYQPVEAKLKLTRSCLEVLERARNPVSIVTKNYLVTRDKDLLSSLAKHNAAMVHLSITTLDREFARILEPRASSPAMRLRAVEELRSAGVRVAVSTAPIIPGLNDHEIPAILKAAADAGAESAFYTMIRLPLGVKEVFASWLERNRPGEREKVLGRIRELRGGRLNASEFGNRMQGTGKAADDLRRFFEVSRRRAGIGDNPRPLSTTAFRRPALNGQMELFD